ncbi:ribonuclease [Sorangium cellulosum]|uniref:4-hydroxy-4-methyl-2-oxoglutarate aldolase n=1 Tax=Sorangium cellulosum TaxID=56 RepID=A0A2L0F3V2_SORCE|nr:ribonuclease E activity regulator RraA [Sorangium cellulosum]AUX46207.1 ribonuclease [Sorangium cellulosum]
MTREITYRTTDLCDEHPEAVLVSDPIFRDYGGARLFHGRVVTVKVHEDNVLVRKTLEGPGEGRVLVVDGGGSLRCALLGDNLAAIAHQNGWAGLVVYGCVRDTEAIAGIPIGVKALATHPRKSGKQGAGERDIPVTFGGITYVPGGFVYADHDGLIHMKEPLT